MADVSTLTRRLRGEYPVGPMKPNGEPEFGWRKFATIPIGIEAAERIEELEEALEGLVGPHWEAQWKGDLA